MSSEYLVFVNALCCSVTAFIYQWKEIPSILYKNRYEQDTKAHPFPELCVHSGSMKCHPCVNTLITLHDSSLNP